MRLRALGDAPDAFWTTLAEDQARAPETWRAGLERPSGATFVATRQGADVGLVVGAEYRGRERTAGLFGMWVAPEARRCGVAGPLVEAVEAWARSAGYERIVLQVGNENAVANEFIKFTLASSTLEVSAVPIPEPSAFVLSILGLAALGIVGWRRRRRA